MMEALVWAVEESGAARCLITSRYELTTTQGAKFYQEQLSAMRQAEADKKRRGLENYRGASDAFKQRLDRVADGNPRLMERLDRVLKDKSRPRRLDREHGGRRDRVPRADPRRRARRRARGTDPAVTRRVLVYEQPVPFEAIPPSSLTARGRPACRPGRRVRRRPRRGRSQPSGPHYRVPAPGTGPRRRPPGRPPRFDRSRRIALFTLWWELGSATEPERLEIARLGRLARRADIAAPVPRRSGGVGLAGIVTARPAASTKRRSQRSAGFDSGWSW
ncbi:MAG: hypothetical protein WKF75_14340 [Singulisphaera sp.]